MALLGGSFDDPRTAAVFAAAQELLGRGGNMQRIAGAGLAYSGMMERAKSVEIERKRREQEMLLTQAQVEAIRKRQEAEAEAQRMRGGFLDSVDPSAGPAMPVSIPAGLKAGLSLQELSALMPGGKRGPLTVKPGEQLVDPDTFKTLFSAPKEQSLPNAVQEYEFARAQGYQGTFQQWVTDKVPRTNINVGTGQKDVNWGTPPKDMVWARDPSGNVITEADPATGALRPKALAVGGSPEDRESSEAARKMEERRRALAVGAKNVLREIQDAKSMVGYGSAGVAGVTAGIPSSPARNLRAKLETVKANLGFDRLQQMRDLSPTGGALGQVAVQELTALQSTVASLDQLQEPGQLRSALEKIERHYSNWLKTIEPNTGGGDPASLQDAARRELERRLWGK
jgi:hypothetical protein